MSENGNISNSNLLLIEAKQTADTTMESIRPSGTSAKLYSFPRSEEVEQHKVVYYNDAWFPACSLPA